MASPENPQITVIKAIKTALDSLKIGKSGKSGLPRKDANRYDRRSAKQKLKQALWYRESAETLPKTERKFGRQLDPNHVIENLGLPDEVLSRPFFSLDNQAVRLLAQSLMDGFK